MSGDLFSGPADKSFGDVVNGRYWFPDPVTGRPRYFTRVTTFAKSVSDTYLLSLWQQRMTAKGVAIRPDLHAAVASLPLTERSKLNELVERAKEAAGATAGANQGSALHTFTERHDRGEKVYVPKPWDADLAAYVALCEKADLRPMPDMIERTVHNDMFDLTGTLDRAVQQEGTSRILDLKTGANLDWGWGEIAVQLYCYASADHVWNPGTEEWEDMPPMDTATALVVHLPVGKATATLYELDLSLGEVGAHLCKKVRDWRSSKGIATPVMSVTV